MSLPAMDEVVKTGQSSSGAPRPRGRTTPPLLNQKLFAPYKLAVLIEAATVRGIAPDLVLERTGMTAEEVADPHALTSIGQYLTAYDNVIAAGADLDLARAVGGRLHLSAYGMYGYALICSPTMRDFFDFAVRYHVLATPTIDLRWRQDGDRAVWEFHEVYRDRMSSDLREFLLRQQMVQTFTHMRDVAGPDALPVDALFALPEPSSVEGDERILGCPCRFGQPAHELHYAAGVLDRAPQLANRMTRRMLEETCDRLIGQAKLGAGVAGEVYQLMMLAPNRYPSMEAIAIQLGTTERTLRRRLDDEGSSYAAIVDDVRRTLTLEYLETTRLSADDIALKVGFSDTANLRRAIKRWTGATMRQVREAAERAF